MDLHIGTVTVPERSVGGLWKHFGPDGWEFAAYHQPDGGFDVHVVDDQGRFAVHAFRLPDQEAAETALASFAEHA